MANPPVNRRPGVDADIIQGTWVRGYDVPAGDQTLPAPSPCDLIISNGKSQIDQKLSNLVFANRTDDISQPIFVMALGDTPTAPATTANFHIGREEDPNGLISAVGPGSLYASTGVPGLWQLQLDDTTWIQISDDLGGEDLQQTLAIGNITGGYNILLTNGDFLKGVDNASGAGADANIAGGNATGVAGNGGKVLLQGGNSVAGVTGGIEANSPIATGTGGSGAFSFATGDSKLGGSSGSIVVKTGETGNVGFGSDSGAVSISGGRNRSTGGGPFYGGFVNVTAGQATSQGNGGSINLRAGASSDINTVISIPAAIAGQGGGVFITGGSSSQTLPGGGISLAAGTGGSGGAQGGNVTLKPGNGGGGFPEGQVIADGVFRADNVQRGSGNPNGSVNGNEGDIYQRTDLGLGQIWLNTSGTNTGWVQLAAVGDFVESFEQLNWGYFSRAGIQVGGSPEDAWDDTGVFKGLRSNSTAGDDPTFGGNLNNGPYVSFEPPNNANVSAVDFSSGIGGKPHAREQQFILTFRARNAVTSTTGRIFLGVSTLDAQTQLSSPIPGGGSYLGFILDGSVGSTWRVVTSDSLGTTGPLDTGILGTTTSAQPEGWHFIIDVTDTVTPVVRFFILDPDLQVQASITVATTLPSLSTPMGLVMGSRRIVGGGVNPTLQVVHASLVNNAGVSGQGGGSISGLSLAQVLINGNTTGITDIEVNQGSNILGVTDDNLGDGASFGIFGGATTLATNDTGSITVASGNAFGGGAENPGSSTGFLNFGTGFQFGATSAGDTGLLSLVTGSHLGTSGTSGDIVITTGLFTNGAVGTRVQGDILIAPGTFAPNTATTTGEIILKGGSSNLTGVVGGDVTLLSGENSSASGDTGNVFVETFSANFNGNSGNLNFTTGTGGTVTGDSGDVAIATGSGTAGSTGAISISTGLAGTGTAGDITLLVGASNAGHGNVLINAGDALAVADVGGDIVLTPGTGPLGDGQVIVNGKLTVTGLIDPTGLVLTGQVVVPTVVPAGDGLLWIDSTAVPSKLIFTDDTNTDHDISTGGGATSLGALTDVLLTAPVPGEVLTFNGVDWVNLAGVGGSPLATILAIGNTTGALPIVVSDTLGSSITSDGDLHLNPAVAPGNKVVLDGLEWPEGDGPAGFVLTTNGLGTLSFQAPGGGAGGPTFGEAFTRMQWGTAQPTGSGLLHLDGLFTLQTVISSSPPGSSNDVNGTVLKVDTAAVLGSSAGVQVEPVGPGLGLELQSLPIVSLKFDGPSLDTNLRFFAGLTDAATILNQTSGPGLPGTIRYVGLGIYTDVPQTTFHFITDDATGIPTTFNTGVSALGKGFELVIDASVAGSVTLTLYDNTGTQLATTTFAGNLPLSSAVLGLMVGATTSNGAAKVLGVYGMNGVTRGDLLNAVGGGGGNQNLASVLGFGNETGGLPIRGDDNLVGSGGDLDFASGSSLGGGGAGGLLRLLSGAPDPAGNGDGGDVIITTSIGAGTGDGGDIIATLGNGGVGGGNGGSWFVTAGDSGTAGASTSGVIEFTTGTGGAGSAASGGQFGFLSGDGEGIGNGGDYLFTAGDGGAGGGDGGSFSFFVGAGNGGGAAGTFSVIGDVLISGKLTVSGMIDPPGLLMSSSGAVPFTPVGSEGGIWVNGAGELVYTNLGGDLNLSTAIGGGMSFLDAMLTAGYGMLSAGNPLTGPLSYGVYGSSSITAVTPGPPPASATFSDDSEGPFTNLAVGAAALSEAFVGTADLMLQRDSQFKARFKFQVTSPAHTDERIFIGFTDDPALVTPSAQLATDDPAAQQYMGIRENLAGLNLEFVARGSGGAMVPVLAIPTDALVHYLEIDASSSTGDVTFTIYDADGVTISGGGSATHTELASFLLPDLALSLRPFFGIHTGTGTTPRGIDFYFSNVVTRADVVDAVTGGGSGGGTPTLSAVLAAGNNAGSTLIEADGGINGGAFNLQVAGGTLGGAGVPGSVRLNTEFGDNGGLAGLRGGDGAGAAGNGGGAQVFAGTGGFGTGSGGSANLVGGSGGFGGGSGGPVSISGGDAFAGNGAGGPITLNSGDGRGTSAGGLLTLLAGGGGLGGGTGDGGRVLIQAGSPQGTGVEGGIGLLAGNASLVGAGLGAVQIVGSPFGGDILTSSTVLVSRALTAAGGPLTLIGGRAPVGSGGDGGDIVLTTRVGDGAGDTGSIHLLGAGGAPIPASGGDVQLVGATLATNSEGASLALDGGSALAGGSSIYSGGRALPGSGLAGGEISIRGGNSDGAVKGGQAAVRGGVGGATGDGGDVQVSGGAATGGANVGGDVRIIPGTGPAGSGQISFEGKIDPAPLTAGLQYGRYTLPAGGAIHVIPFNVAFATPPTTVTFSIESAALAAAVIFPGSVLAGSFVITTSVPLALGDIIRWTAIL